MSSVTDSTPDDRPALDGAGLLAEARELLADTVRLRRRIHQEPELGLQLPSTQAKVLEAVGDLDVEIITGEGLSSVVVTLRGDGDGPTLLLRGDMDALPLHEDSGEPFASTTPGVMHACGHDAHTAMLAGAVRLLRAHRSELRGTVKFLFQPGEESHHGARYCIEEGVLENPAVDAGFALHVYPNIPSGMLVCRPGPVLAASDELKITVTGQGGHASTPHLAVDPMPVACEIVTALQTHLTRSVNPFHPAVLTVARIAGGTTNNVIPESVEMEGTLRTVDEATRQALHDSVRRVAAKIAEAHGCQAEVGWTIGYPVTVNDDAFTDFAMAVMRDLVGPDQVYEMPAPAMGAEDWSYVLQRVPGAMAFLGVCPPEEEFVTAEGCHSNRMRMDEEPMAIGIATHAAIALSYLS